VASLLAAVAPCAASAQQSPGPAAAQQVAAATATPGAPQAPALPPLPLGPLAQTLDAPLLKSVRTAENFEPAIQHEAQSRAAAAKLAELRRRFKRPPNILVLLVDDLGLGDVGVYGGGEAIGAPTPYIDRLAREGLKLTATYAQPTCTPTRAAMLTGRLTVRSGLVIPPLGGSKASSSQEVFSAKVLSEAGYRTALSGKWHLGEVPGSRPTEVGFDEFLGFLTVINTYQDWRDPNLSPQAALDPEVQDAMRRSKFRKNLVRGRKGEPLQDLEEITMEVSANVD
jgi:arylsulfatase